MKKILVCVSIACVVCLDFIPVKAAALSESDALRTRIEEQDRKIETLIEKVNVLEAGEKETKASWADNIKISGDFRFRYGYIDKEGSDVRHRGRLRARLKLLASLSGTLDTGFQVASGDENPNSTNQTFGDAFTTKALSLDMAYFDWHPDVKGRLHFIGGKMKNPFTSPGKTALIWDGDLRPEGGVLTYRYEADAMETFVTLGGFWVEERKSDADSALFGMQTGVRLLLRERSDITAALAYYDYANIEGFAPLYDDDSFGNTLDDDGNFATDFNIVDVFLQYGMKVRGVPVALFAEYAVNTAADGNDRAYLLGFIVGKTVKPKSWDFRYTWREIEPDAVFGTFTDSDFGGGGTDVKGHKLAFNYQIAEGWKLAVTYYRDTFDLDDEKRFERVNVDFKFNF